MKRSTIGFIIAGLLTVLGAGVGFYSEQVLFIENSNKMLLDMKQEIMSNDEDKEED